MTRSLLIMGPTASGKSALALALAERIGGEIVNADSMQVYRDFRVLTARPTLQEEAQTPHHLYGHIDAAERYSTGRWLGDALATIADIRARGRTPILVGGTGLYFRALTQGLAEMPKIDPELRAALAARAQKQGAPALYAELARLDPLTAQRLKPNDGPRIIRALEVLETTGESISSFQADTKPSLMSQEWRGIALTPNRDALYAVINARFEKMLEEGALEEVRAFASRNLDPTLPAAKAHGARALCACLRGEMVLDQAKQIGQRDTRRYAKRQFTWIANQMRNWPRFAPNDLSERVAAALNALAAR
jgi:tRNA dimethylallyltransferase